MLTASYSCRSELAEQFYNAIEREGNILFCTDSEEDLVAEFARSAVSGLASEPKWLDCRFLYDSVGSDLYEQITQQPEYYPTRTEAAILSVHAHELYDMTGPVVLVELGSGSSVKTNHLLYSYLARESRVCYVPVDVSGSALEQAGYEICRTHPKAQVIGINGIYQDAFPLLKKASPTMLVFLGSTIGNLNEAEADRFWRQVQKHLPVGDFFLLGVDLVKDEDILNAAYNDAAGVTARFTLNLFDRMNRELGADLDLKSIEHQARYEPSRQRMEIFARFHRAQDIHIAPLDMTFHIKEGERIMTEISRKFRLETLIPYLERYGLTTRKVMTDEKDWFAVLLLQRES
jgi:L-histidine N-alpha-methyltransferase